MNTQSPPEPTTTSAVKSWVWHGSLASRASGKISVLACAETAVAVALYWWIAIRWDTHWHLLSSVFVAPLLLLRSPDSIAAAVRWFTEDLLGLQDYDTLFRKYWGLVVTYLILIGLIQIFIVRIVLTGMPELHGEHMWIAVCLLSIGVELFGFGYGLKAGLGLGLPGAVAFANAFARIFAIVLKVEAVVALILVFIGSYELITEIFIGTLIVFTTPMIGAGFGYLLRALICRILATLIYLSKGMKKLPENWKENNFLVDSFVPAELMPGIRVEQKIFTLDGLVVWSMGEQDRLGKWFIAPLLSVFFFVPVLLYRINIKATCWFWWPLAYLLKPFPNTDKESQQKQALCWPWDNRWQTLLILGPAFLVSAVLIYDYYDPAALNKLQNASAVPIPLKLILGMRWAHILPWHWALGIVEVCGIGMLMLAGRACSHKENDNWEVYAQSGLKKDLFVINTLIRVRSLAAIAFILFGLGMCLISFPEWKKFAPPPILHRLEKFYESRNVD